MKFTSVRVRIAAAVAGLAAVASIAGPMAAQANTDTAPERTGYANLAHAADLTLAGIPASARAGQRGTGAAPYPTWCMTRRLAQVLPSRHGQTYWLDYHRTDGDVFLEQEVTQANSAAAAHAVGMALYEQALHAEGCPGRGDSQQHPRRHAIGIDGGSITYVNVEDGPWLSTVSVIRMGKRVSVVAVGPTDGSRGIEPLLVHLADRMR